MARQAHTQRNAAILRMVRAGATYLEAAEEFGVSRSVIAGVCGRGGLIKKSADMPRSNRIPEVIRLRDEGMTWREIAQRLGYSRAQAARSAAEYWMR